MNEDGLSKRIVAHLNRGTEELPAQVLVKLRVAREAAMDRARERGNWSRNGSGLALVASRWFAMRMAIPVLFVLAALFISINALVNQFTHSMFGLGIILLGVPAYLFWHRKQA